MLGSFLDPRIQVPSLSFPFLACTILSSLSPPFLPHSFPPPFPPLSSPLPTLPSLSSQLWFSGAKLKFFFFPHAFSRWGGRERQVMRNGEALEAEISWLNPAQTLLPVPRDKALYPLRPSSFAWKREMLMHPIFNSEVQPLKTGLFKIWVWQKHFWQ